MSIPERKQVVLIGLSVAITKWANDRRIISMDNSKGQYMKLVSEFGEIVEGIRESDDIKIQDGIGDTFVMLNNVSSIFGGEIICLINNPCEPSNQILHFVEHMGKLADYVAKNQRDKALETLGLLGNDLQLICEALGFDFVECVEVAYNEIKDRRGVMYSGVFVKEDDARYQGIMQELEMQDLDESRAAEGTDA